MHFGSSKTTMTLGQMRDDLTLHFSLTSSVLEMYSDAFRLYFLRGGEKAFLNALVLHKKK